MIKDKLKEYYSGSRFEAGSLLFLLRPYQDNNHSADNSEKSYPVVSPEGLVFSVVTVSMIIENP